MIRFITLLFLFSTIALSEAIYVGQNSAGSDTGADAANRHAISWLNSSGNWGSGAGVVGAGDTVHLVGTFTTALNVAGSGTSGNPVTFLFETGANFTSPVWPAAGAIQMDGVSWITIDGGANGLIRNTDNGPALGHQSSSRGIGGNGNGTAIIDHGIVKNLTVTHIYRKEPGINNWDRLGYCIDLSGTDLTVQNCTVSDGDGLIGMSLGNSLTGSVYRIVNNVLRDFNHGITMGPGDISSAMSDVVISGNDIDYSVTWDTTGDSPIHLDAIILLNNTYDTGSRLDGVRICNNHFGPNVGTRTTAAIFNSLQGQSKQCRNWYIYNNLFECGSGYLWGNGYITSSAENMWVFNNTFGGASTSDRTSSGSAVQSGGNPSHYVNNLNTTLHGYTTISTSDIDVTAPVNGTDTANVLSTYFGNNWADYNLYSGGTDAGVVFGVTLWKYQPSDILWPTAGLNGFEAWQTWYDNNRGMPVPIWNTAHADPHGGTGTVTFTVGTYIPAPSDTVAVGKGTNLSSVFLEMGVPAVDYNGTSRPATGPWTIGAYESGTTPAEVRNLRVNRFSANTVTAHGDSP